jgi:hypothetical protein
MKTITQEQLLMERIEHLQFKQDIELRQLKSQVHGSIQLLNPLSIIRSTLFGSDNSPDTKADLMNTAVNITSQFISRNSVLGLFQKPIKTILGNILQRFIK